MTSSYSALYVEQFYATSFVLNNFCLNHLQILFKFCTVYRTAPCAIRCFNYLFKYSLDVLRVLNQM